MTHVDGNVTVNPIMLYANLKNLIKKKKIKWERTGTGMENEKINK